MPDNNNHTEIIHNSTDAQNNTEIKYPSGDLLLSIVQKEYDYETTRKTVLETRTGVLITLAAAILTFTFSNIKLPKIKTPINEFSSLIFYVSYFLIGATAVITIGISLCYLLRVLFIAKYNRLDTTDINRQAAGSVPDVVATALMEQYEKILRHNQNVNNDKMILYHKGTNWLIISLFTSVILYGIALNL
ncbi:hypothetical protein FKQ51_24680 [Bacillus toyonensis]|uniref:hypothetical protein n=1 Tax=Bacillus toyonensis TaxID=155322 RepID=UPI002710A838|nr:hypothetical protein [Bacillus toyonensis]MDO8160452.1 hypothetical protein [Bacillus toyonensis]